MEFASYPKVTLRNTLPTQRSAEPALGNHAATLTWQGSSDTPSEFFLQESGSGGTSFLGSKHPLLESYTGVTDSNCALSLLSRQTWGSRNTAPATSVELNNNLLNFNGTSMTQFSAASSQAAAIHQLPNATSWLYLKGVGSGDCSPEGVPDLGLGQISPPLDSHLHGELNVSQQGRRHYMDLGESRACESSHWSLWRTSMLSVTIWSVTRLALTTSILVSLNLEARWVYPSFGCGTLKIETSLFWFVWTYQQGR